MRPARTWVASGLLGSALATILLWQAGVPALLLFLAFPLVPVLLRRRAGRADRTDRADPRPIGPPPADTHRWACPRCGWSTLDPADRFCPRDGGQLQKAERGLAGNP